MEMRLGEVARASVIEMSNWEETSAEYPILSLKWPWGLAK